MFVVSIEGNLIGPFATYTQAEDWVVNFEPSGKIVPVVDVGLATNIIIGLKEEMKNRYGRKS